MARVLAGWQRIQTYIVTFGSEQCLLKCRNEAGVVCWCHDYIPRCNVSEQVGGSHTAGEGTGHPGVKQLQPTGAGCCSSCQLCR